MNTYVIYLMLCTAKCQVLPTPYVITEQSAERAQYRAMREVSHGCRTAGFIDTDDALDTELVWHACGQYYKIYSNNVLHY